jgi:hypothetical protein
VAEGASVAAVNAFLSALFQGTAFSLADGWVKWHVGAPGPAGTANPATETRRVQIIRRVRHRPHDGGDRQRHGAADVDERCGDGDVDALVLLG